jgi:prepilin-type N-terminal cleavage/methylation domain-containing protein
MLKRLLKTKKGFTLVELIVTMALFAILGIGAMSLLILTANVFNSAATANNVQTATLTMVDTVRLNAYSSNDVTILKNYPRNDSEIDVSGKYEYIYFVARENTFYRIPAGTTNRIAMNISGLARNRALAYTVKFYNPSVGTASNLLGMKVEVRDSRSGTNPIYTYQTNLEFHNILQLVTDPSSGKPASEDPIEQTEESGVVTDTTGGAGGTCIKYAVTV